MMDDLRQVALIEGLAADRTDVEVLRFVCGLPLVPGTCNSWAHKSSFNSFDAEAKSRWHRPSRQKRTK